MSILLLLENTQLGDSVTACMNLVNFVLTSLVSNNLFKMTELVHRILGVL